MEMTEITAKPFDWNDNLSEEAIEDFETIRGKLTYCQHQSIGMALAKLELLEKQGCKVIDPSGSSSEKPNKWIPVSERLPEKTGIYLISIGDLVTSKSFDGHNFRTESEIRFVPDAWQPLPEPYKAEGSGEE